MKISWKFMKEHLYLGTPLIITSLISGSAQYTDGIIVSAVYRDPAMFAWFRYGAKEFPLVLLLANGLSNAMLPEFSTRSRMKESLAKDKTEIQKTDACAISNGDGDNALFKMVLSTSSSIRVSQKCRDIHDLYIAHNTTNGFSPDYCRWQKENTNNTYLSNS